MPVRKRSVLIVDEDAYLAGIYGRRFEAGGWHVRVAESAEEARKLLSRRVPQAVIIDVEHVEDGLALVSEIRGAPKTAGVALVALSTLGKRDVIASAQRAGANAYLLKGHFVPSEIVEKIDRLVAGAAATL